MNTKVEATPLGEWRWYLGDDDLDEKMCECTSREDAIQRGRAEVEADCSFYIIEARMLVSDEDEMAAGSRDTALFTEMRNGEWIDPVRATLREQDI